MRLDQLEWTVTKTPEGRVWRGMINGHPAFIDQNAHTLVNNMPGYQVRYYDKNMLGERSTRMTPYYLKHMLRSAVAEPLEVHDA